MALTITPTVKDVNSSTIALTGDSDVLIRYKSNAQATMSLSGAVYNEDMCIIRNGGETGYGKTYTFNNVESGEFRFHAEDINGNVVTATVNSQVIPYVELTCYMENNKPDGDGNMRVECSGDYFNGSFGAKWNSLTVRCRYKKAGGSYSGWYNMTVYTSGNTYTAYADLTGLDYKASYSFEVEAEDELTAAESSESGVSSLPLFHWGQHSFTFEVPVAFNNADDETTFAGDIRLRNGSANYGNRLLFGDGEYCYIAEKTDDEMTIHAAKINFEADSLYLNGGFFGIPEVGHWTPKLYSSAVNEYSTQMGWYTRTGTVVTVGFYIKAECDSGYHSKSIEIDGLPYKPAYSASGGGICSGAYLSGGWTFQCFVAERNAYDITVRVQECDRDSSENMGTSASGCRYPEDGGELTLSGTITYWTEE